MSDAGVRVFMLRLPHTGVVVRRALPAGDLSHSLSLVAEQRSRY